MGVEEIEVTIDASGAVKVHVRGISGADCLTATAELERVLGGDVIERSMTSEAYEQSVSEETQNWQQT